MRVEVATGIGDGTVASDGKHPARPIVAAMIVPHHRGVGALGQGPPRIEQQAGQFDRKIGLRLGMPRAFVGMLQETGQKICPARKIVGQVRLPDASSLRDLRLGQSRQSLGIDDGLRRIQNAPSDIAAQRGFPYDCRRRMVPV